MDQETKSKSRHEVIVAKVPWSAGVAGASQCGELPLMVTSEGELQPKVPTLTPPPHEESLPNILTDSAGVPQCLKDAVGL